MILPRKSKEFLVELNYTLFKLFNVAEETRINARKVYLTVDLELLRRRYHAQLISMFSDDAGNTRKVDFTAMVKKSDTQKQFIGYRYYIWKGKYFERETVRTHTNIGIGLEYLAEIEQTFNIIRDSLIKVPYMTSDVMEWIRNIDIFKYPELKFIYSELKKLNPEEHINVEILENANKMRKTEPVTAPTMQCRAPRKH